MSDPNEIIGLDIGQKKIGVARMNRVARIPEPLCVLENNQSLIKNLTRVINEYSSSSLVVGLPRNMRGEETDQSQFTRQQAHSIASELGLELEFVDETLTSVEAASYVARGDDDAVAAALILQNYSLVSKEKR